MKRREAMKRIVVWKNRFILFGMMVMALLFISGCSGDDLTPKSGSTPTPTPWPAFNTSNLPLAVTGASGGYGSFAFDANGNLLFVANNTDEIRLLDRSTCTVTTVATGVSGGSTLLGMIYYQDFIYVGAENGNLYKVNPTNGSSTVLTTFPMGEELNGVVIAPATYGSYGGQLIVASDTGNIYAVDQSAALPTPVLIADIGTSPASALIFGNDGTLYVADHYGDKIVTVTAAGVVADFATGLSEPDGLAINSSGNLLYVANSDDDTVKSVTIPGGIVTTIFTPVDFDSGFWPSPIIFDDPSNSLLVGTGEVELIISNYNF